MSVEEIYRENILDHYNYPRNKGSLKSPDIFVKDSNPLCGDVVEFGINMNYGKVSEAKFDGKGCAICLASASMLTDFIKGKKAGEVLQMEKKTILKLLGIEPSPNRLKCALLPMEVLKIGMKMYKAQSSKVRFVRENESMHQA